MTTRSPDSPKSRRRGAVAVVMAICLIPLIGVLAFVLDGGLLMAQRRRSQTVADASAHAAATYLYKNYGTDAGLDPSGKARALALTIASANGYLNDGTGTVITVNIPPTSGTFGGQAGCAEVIAQFNQPRMFSGIWGSGTIPVVGRASARGSLAPVSQASLILLDPSAAGALSVAGSGHVIAATGIQVNSTNVAAVNANNAGYATASTISIGGNYTTSSSGYLSGTIQTAASAVSDPLSTLAAPSTSGLTTQGSVPTYGTFTINPGVYNGGITFGGGSNVTMNPGIYYMKAGSFTVANGVTLNGTGVMVYVDNGGGSFSFQGGGVINMTAPTSGTYAGVVMYQDRASSKAISIANGSTTNITGTFYAAGAAMNFAGGASASSFGSQIIAKTMNISNNADIRLNWSSTTVARSKSMSLVE